MLNKIQHFRGDFIFEGVLPETVDLSKSYKISAQNGAVILIFEKKTLEQPTEVTMENFMEWDLDLDA